MTTAQNLDVNQLQNENRELRCEIVYLQEQLDWLKRQIFGKRSERLVPSHKDQLMFDGFAEEKETKQQTQIVPAHERSKPNRNGQDSIVLPGDIPVKTIVIDIPEQDKVCKETGLLLVKIGEEKTQKLAHEPGSYYIKEIIRPKYAHPKRPENGIITAFLPDSILPRCRADDSFLAEIVT